MVYVKEKSEEELKLRENYFNLNKVNVHKMSKEGKLENRRQKKEMKDRIQQEDKKRIELITKHPIQYRMLKVNSNVLGVALLNYICSFTPKEIHIAKKCILNKMKMPPNYDLPDISGKNDDLKSISQSMVSQLTEASYHLKPLDDFGNIPNLIDPTPREQSGGWLTDSDLANVFQYLIIYFDLNKLPHYQSYI